MRKLTYYLFLATLMTSCGVSDSVDSGVISTIQAEMKVSLANPFDSPSHFALRMSTLDEKCDNSQILADGAVQGHNVHIAVSGLLLEPACNSSYRTIQKDIPIDIAKGEYNFTMSIGEALFNDGTLTYDGETYKLEMFSTFGIKIGQSTLRKIPEGIIWGAISGDKNISNIRQEFLSALAPITSEPNVKEGYYGHFTIQNSDILNISLTDDEVLGFPHLFVYKLDGDPTGLQFVIDHFREKYAGSINIACTSWSGESF